MLNSNKPIVVPGVFDAIGAKIAQKVGFPAMFQTGYGTSATLFGMPDLGYRAGMALKDMKLYKLHIL